MSFHTLKLDNFRNIESCLISCGKKAVYFVGNNGQGKSNILEAIYYLCYGSSFRTHLDEHCIKNGTPGGIIQGTYDQDGFTRNIEIKIEKGRKEIYLDGKMIRDRRELMDTVPCIVFCHEDIQFVKGSPENQRQFLNQSASLVFPEFLASLRNFTKILKTRNLIIKDGNLDLLDTINVQFIQYGLEIVQYRNKIIDIFNAIMEPLVSEINPDLTGIELVYHASWYGKSSEQINEILGSKKDGELRMGTSTWGPHRDKISFSHLGSDFIPKASTGQARLLSLLLRLTQASVIYSYTGKKPLLLMDDVLLELDDEKRMKFLSKLPDHEQAFYTFLPGARIPEDAKSQGSIVWVNEGTFSE